MKTKTYWVALLLALSLAEGASAQGVVQYIVGYVNDILRPGDNLINNPLDNGQSDTLVSLFAAPVPNGTTVALWNPTLMAFTTASTYSGGQWSVNLTLLPGTGFLVDTPSMFTNTFTGIVLNHDGTPLHGDNLTPPPVFAGPNGVYLLGDACPTTDTGNDIFLNLLGRQPNVGETVELLNAATQTYTTDTYLGNGNWDNLPTLNYGYAAFLGVESAPEPGALSLLVLAGVVWSLRRTASQPA